LFLCGFAGVAVVHQKATGQVVHLDELMKVPAAYVAAQNGVAILAYFPTTPGVTRSGYTQGTVDQKTYDIYIGSGTILKGGLVLTAAHLLTADKKDKTEATKPTYLVLIKSNFDHPINVIVVAQTQVTEDVLGGDDYALLKPAEDLNEPGAMISRNPAATGDVITYFGNIKGQAFFVRKTFVSYLDREFYADGGRLRLNRWPNGPYMVFSPGGSGDSGGGVYNEDGFLVGVIFAGRVLDEDGYVISESLDKLQNFIHNNNLDEVIQK